MVDAVIDMVRSAQGPCVHAGTNAVVLLAARKVGRNGAGLDNHREGLTVDTGRLNGADVDRNIGVSSRGNRDCEGRGLPVTGG
ncbi:hypothetical protein SDC9_146479 [bioreactor metagenome]|uniref:Uncharacterized protein n=1 Tax=bioreactor metagenome TaxID=1076179 RepID=A0A645EDT4_9ZZZZ